ncbi:unnamed protein product [Leuciscus chuanchicus]
MKKSEEKSGKERRGEEMEMERRGEERRGEERRGEERRGEERRGEEERRERRGCSIPRMRLTDKGVEEKGTSICRITEETPPEWSIPVRSRAIKSRYRIADIYTV